MEATPLWGTTTTPSLKHGTPSQDEETNGGMFGRRLISKMPLTGESVPAPAPDHNACQTWDFSEPCLPKFPELEQHLWELSDPSHPRYGAHLSKEEADTLMAPHPEALDIVNGWLASHGLVEESLIRSSANDWVTIRVPCRRDGGYREQINLVSGDCSPLTTGCLDLLYLQAC
jgi:hypothetical protein